MNFLFYSAANSFGGGEKYLSLIIPALRSRGHRADLVLREVGAPKALMDLRDPEFLPGPDTIAVFNGIGSLYKWSLTRRSRYKVKIFIQHSSLSDDQSGTLKYFLRPILFCIFSRSIRTIIRVCRSSFPDRATNKNIVTIYNGVPVNDYKYNTRNSSDPFVIAMIGSVNKNKNQKAALDILKLLPRDCFLKIIGDGPDLNSLQAYAQNLGVSTRVKWTGFVSDSTTELRDCHVVLILSNNEAFPFAALEAMSMGLPVVSYDIGGLPELITNNHNGFLVPHGDLDGIHEAVRNICQNEGMRKHISWNAHSTIANHFSLDHMVDKFISTSLDAISK